MSFNMQDVKRKNKPKKEAMSEYSGVLNSSLLITPNVKQALWQYVLFRIFKRRNSKFSANVLEQMIEDMFVYIIKKPYENIRVEDVINNENQIIYEIANAIFYGNLHHLYYDDSSSVTDIRFKEPKPITLNRQLTNNELEDYFKNIMV